MSATQYHPAVHPLVASLSFDDIRRKLIKGEGDAPLSEALVAHMEHEYRRFLTMHLLHPEATLVPTKTVDAFWHAHILDTVAYARDTQTVFGKFLHHFPYFGSRSERDAVDLANAFEETCALYVSTLGSPPAGAESARCGDDHACHAQSDCACRVPGACK